MVCSLPARQGVLPALANMEILVVYVHFRSSAYIQKMALYLAVLSGLEFSGSWNAFLTLLFFFPMLIYSPRSVTGSPE